MPYYLRNGMSSHRHPFLGGGCSACGMAADDQMYAPPANSLPPLPPATPPAATPPAVPPTTKDGGGAVVILCVLGLGAAWLFLSK